ncbi:MAG: hypothetical protein EP341_02955 [Sphingomonadales bacterium]|nr:MAG: hypothetical protein EP341_02955 [Sphingomonadales bacterium]
MMTEEEAKTKKCPIVSREPNVQPCAGSDCMMWRWLPAFNAAGKELVGSTKGFCGLAGKP